MKFIWERGFLEYDYLCFMLRKILFSGILFAGLALSVSAQFYYGGISGNYSLPGTSFVTDSAGNVRFQPHDIHFTMSAGAFAGSNFNGNSWFGTSVSPALSYNVSPRFRVSAGVSLSQGYGGNYYPGYESYYSPMGSSSTTTSVFVRGDYIVNNKLMISGAAYKYFSPLNLNSTNPRFKSPEGEGYMLNINYRPVKNFEINASVGYGNDNGFYHQNPFGGQSVPFAP